MQCRTCKGSGLMSFPDLLPSKPGDTGPRFVTRTVDCWDCSGGVRTVGTRGGRAK